MKIYLAGQFSDYDIEVAKKNNIKYLLQTFYDINRMDSKRCHVLLSLVEKENFLLDSGAFTFMNTGKKVNWKEYVNNYISFINKYDIKYFFELDLYVLQDVGIETTHKIRKYIEHHTGKKSIPVFHKCLGIKGFRTMCEEYDYIAIGASGLIDECKWVNNETLLSQFIRIAKQYNTKVHGLGYTRTTNINTTTIPFYSVDSSSWTYGRRFGMSYAIKNNRLVTKNNKCNKTGIRLTQDEFSDINIPVWCKIQHLKENI